eukprot:TRINITY_DN459_c0_g1_i5.p2 TRINITY_DN459_c0_g1~~TRINITY_DN459_c0_g1_i5.p2  ORF type:complete len:126 (+),score=23.46 TRINITY_DN459_c0_g1_i5:813-1190(+)
MRDSLHLTCLRLSSNNIDDICALHLAELLKRKGSRLRGLFLQSNEIKDQGARTLSSALQSNSTLVELDLSRMKVQSKTMAHKHTSGHNDVIESTEYRSIRKMQLGHADEHIHTHENVYNAHVFRK